MSNSWFSITDKTADEWAEVRIYDEIGAWGVTADAFVKALDGIKAKTIDLRLNTPGGEVFSATAIHNALKEHPAKVIVYIDGIAASSGSFIAMAGDEIRIADNAYMMIHNAIGGIKGGAEQVKSYADLLEKVNGTIAGMYEKRTGKPVDHWRGLMDAETWFTADEAKDAGLADTIYAAAPKNASPARAIFNLANYTKVPDAVKELWGIPANLTALPITPALEGPLSSEPSPPASFKETDMAETAVVTSAPAQPPAAGTNAVPQGNQEAIKLNQQTIQAYIDQGRSIGRAEGAKAEQDRMRAIMNAAPGMPEIAISGFLAGHSEQTVGMIASIQAQANAAAQEKAAGMEVEIARLQNLVATGGHPGVSAQVFTGPKETGNEVMAGLEPEAQAKMEWDSDPMLRARNGNNEKAFTLYRVNQLKGNVRVLARS